MAQAGRARDDHARRLGHRPRQGKERRRRGVRHDLRTGRGRLPAHRGQLSDRARPNRRSRGREGDLAGLARPALRQRSRAEGAITRPARLAEAADGRLGGRPELLSRHAPAGAPARAHPVRAVDGAAASPKAASAATSSASTSASFRNFYAGKRTLAAAERDLEPRGSNGIAIAPAITAGGNALLLINPHTSFFFRSELQVTSDEGLNAYGAATWGQFFIYQGFNEHAGWMHTSSGVDNVDEFAEKVERKGKRRLLSLRHAVPPARRAPGHRPLPHCRRHARQPRSFTTWRTHHGPIVREANGRWIAFAMMDKPVAALQQSFLRTKTRDLADFLKVADLKANSSNNTIFAERQGRDRLSAPAVRAEAQRPLRLSRSRSTAATRPPTGARCTGSASCRTRSTRRTAGCTMTITGPTARPVRTAPTRRASRNIWTCSGRITAGMHALQLLTGSKGWTLDRLQAAAFDTYQPGFAELIPSLIKAYDALPKKDARRDAARRPDRSASKLGLSLERRIGAAVAGHVLGRRPDEGGRRARGRAGQRNDHAARPRHQRQQKLAALSDAV